MHTWNVSLSRIIIYSPVVKLGWLMVKILNSNKSDCIVFFFFWITRYSERACAHMERVFKPCHTQTNPHTNQKGPQGQ